MKKFILSTLSGVILFLFLANITWIKPDELDIKYEKYQLDNGLDVILHVDRSDPIVALAIQYHVGSNRELKGKTGFAHLFEHMMFQRSENVGEDQFFKYIQDAGGTLNGGTSNDGTIYFEVVPKNALEKILWLESDRMGYMINTVTQKAFQIQQNVVQNEKRQGVDNRPYGHTRSLIAKELYPDGHPYSWTVIGEMEDLFNATVEDVKAFHAKYYVPNNATLVLAGDFDPAVAKKLIKKYYGEIKKGKELDDPNPIPVKLNETKKIYHEDNFARTSQLNMIWPTVEQYHKDSYALSYLGQLLSSGKNAPLYKVLEKEKKLTSRQYAYNRSLEIAGTFSINVTAGRNVSLDDIEKGIFEAFERFEKEGITDDDVERINAGLETQFYNGISSILGKSFQLARYNEYGGSPDFYKTYISNLKKVTKEDIVAVYNKYIKGKNYVATSFVPKGQTDKMIKGSSKANILEEDIKTAVNVNISEDEVEEEIKKTPSSFDRSLVPKDGPMPKLNLPNIWEIKLKNEIKVLGIVQNELPLVEFSIVLKGGHYLDSPNKSGVASLLSTLMMEGTKNKTPQELEEEIDKLGASINISADRNSIKIYANCLERNYEKVIDLIEEIILEPRWDAEEFEMAKRSVLNQLMRQKADPNYIASSTFNKLIYGEKHIFSVGVSGNEETVKAIEISDLKEYYNKYFSPSVTSFHIVGNIKKERVFKSLKDLESKWKVMKIDFPVYEIKDDLTESKIYFVDVPGAKQSVISIGKVGPAATDKEFYPVTVMNYKLGGSFNGFVNLVLREEKGFTYGARTNFSGDINSGIYKASSSVRSSATFESVQIFKNLMEEYRGGISEDDLSFTKNALIKSNAREFETLRSLIRMLEGITMYNKNFDYIKKEEETVNEMTIDKHKKLAEKYITPGKMYFIVVGDAETQMEKLKEIGYGDPILVK